MQQEFKNWLISQGFKEYSASGNRSTVLDYLFRINKICNNLNISKNNPETTDLVLIYRLL